jgi:REP element-mobilizing transposase RayT
VWAKNNDYSDFRWQERYYDRIVRNQEALDKIRQYIRTNPKNWEKDRNNFDEEMAVYDKL